MENSDFLVALILFCFRKYRKNLNFHFLFLYLKDTLVATLTESFTSYQSFQSFKKTVKIEIFRLFSKAKTKDCGGEDWSVSDKFGIIKPSSATYLLEMGVPVSLKLTIKASFGGKKTLKIQIFRPLF